MNTFIYKIIHSHPQSQLCTCVFELFTLFLARLMQSTVSTPFIGTWALPSYSKESAFISMTLHFMELLQCNIILIVCTLPIIWKLSFGLHPIENLESCPRSCQGLSKFFKNLHGHKQDSCKCQDFKQTCHFVSYLATSCQDRASKLTWNRHYWQQCKKKHSGGSYHKSYKNFTSKVCTAIGITGKYIWNLFVRLV